MDTKMERDLISEQMRKEGGSSKDSLSAQMQSDVAKNHVRLLLPRPASSNLIIDRTPESLDLTMERRRIVVA